MLSIGSPEIHPNSDPVQVQSSIESPEIHFNRDLVQVQSSSLTKCATLLPRCQTNKLINIVYAFYQSGWCVDGGGTSSWQLVPCFKHRAVLICQPGNLRQTYLASVGRRSSSPLSYGRAVHCTLRPVTPWESPMESSIAVFLIRRPAFELTPTTNIALSPALRQHKWRFHLLTSQRKVCLLACLSGLGAGTLLTHFDLDDCTCTRSLLK